MVSFNALEQMNSKTLALIDADGGQYARTRAFEIARNLVESERSHLQVRMIPVDDQSSPAAGDAERGGQAMRPAGERRERLRRFGEIAGLVEDPAVERERLVGTNAISVRTFRADCEGLRPRQFDGDVRERAAFGETPILQRALVDLRRDRLGVQSRG